MVLKRLKSAEMINIHILLTPTILRHIFTLRFVYD
ncbi:hypothetical protein E2C01_007586 [Portunus trituberculatus]|uniref:Uncharacterized protein n=1 Tax=Portunus trituberculatus TaxID=210409 RepID=A0A5B7CZE0_PORTR|nr:hypothetical protein [Portunus trituberculatus]